MKMHEHRQWQKRLNTKIRLQQAAIEVSHHRFTCDLSMEVGGGGDGGASVHFGSFPQRAASVIDPAAAWKSLPSDYPPVTLHQALPVELQDHAREPDYELFPSERWIPTHTAPIEGYMESHGSQDRGKRRR